MGGSTIKGISIEISGETTLLEKAFSDVGKKSKGLQKELMQVERMLKLDPKNTELLAQKQKILAEAVANTKTKLEGLKNAQQQVNEQFKKGEISEAQYRDFQREIVKTKQELKGLEGRLDSTAKKIGDFGSKLSNAGTKFAPISGAAAAAGAALVTTAVKAGQAADDLNTMAKVTGLSTDTLQRFQLASEVIDVSMETLTGSLRKVTKNMGAADGGNKKAIESFDKLGVSIYDSQGNLRDNEDVMNDSINALAKMSNETERDAAAMDIFGKSAQDLNPLILGGADALKTLGDEAAKRGLIIPQEELDRVNEFNDELDMLKAEGSASLNQLGASVGEALLPMLKELAGIIRTVAEAFRNMSPTTAKLILGVLGIVATIAPLLIVIGKIATGVSVLMPLFASLGPLLATVAGAFAAISAPVWIAIAAVAALIVIGVAVYKNWDLIKVKVGAAWDAVKEKVSGVTASIKAIFTGLISKLKSIGGDMISGLWSGISNRLKWIKGKIADAMDGITKKVKAVFGIHSPSKVFAGIGENISAGLVSGITGQTGMVEKAINGLTNAGDFAGRSLSGQKVGVTQTVNHAGVITVKGVNNQGDLIGVTEIIAREISEGNRRVSNRTRLIPIG